MSIAEVITTGFVMGAVGSFHCIGMCGPLALSLPVSHRSDWGRVIGGLIYNSGRILTYSILGLLLGFAGQYLVVAKYQNILSISLGVIIFIYLFIPKKVTASSTIVAIANKPFIKLRAVLGKLFTSKKYSSLFAIGILNGLLPCGMIYLAVTSSFLTGSAMTGSLFMFSFGLGTFPIMLSVVFFGSFFGQQLRMKIRKAVPVFLFVMAVLLVMRGLNLGIPYISPYVSDHSVDAMSCH
jgi:sulfite exporter TauE/SafE